MSTWLLAIYKELSHVLLNLILLKKKYNTISTKLKAGPSNFLCVSKFQNFDTKLYKQSQ